MKTLKKHLILLIVLASIIFSALITFFSKGSFQIFQILGYTAGILIVSGVFSIIPAVIQLIRKKYSWENLKNSILIIWSCIIILLIASNLFTNNIELKKTNDTVQEFKELVTRFSGEIIAQKRKYHKMLASVPVTNIQGIEIYKDKKGLFNIKQNMILQESIEDSNFNTSKIIIDRWKNTFINFLNNSNDSKVNEWTKIYEENLNFTLQGMNELRKFQKYYYEKSYEYYDFLISKNENFQIVNGTLNFNSDKDLSKFNSLQNEYNKATNEYINFVENWKKKMANNAIELKKSLNIRELDTLINMLQNDNYEQYN